MTSILSIPFFLAFFLLFFFHQGRPETLVIEDVRGAEWKIPILLRLGDSIVFKHKGPSVLYVFPTEKAYDHCVLAQATFVSRDKSSAYFTWHPSRTGGYYLSLLRSGSLPVCSKGEKIQASVITPDLSPGSVPSQAPPPTPGDDFYPTLPHTRTFASPSPEAGAPSGAPSEFAGSGGSIPFISSNPAVPLPTGQTDPSFMHPLPITGDGNGGQGMGTMGMGSHLALVALTLVIQAMATDCCSL